MLIGGKEVLVVFRALLLPILLMINNINTISFNYCSFMNTFLNCLLLNVDSYYKRCTMVANLAINCHDNNTKYARLGPGRDV